MLPLGKSKKNESTLLSNLKCHIDDLAYVFDNNLRQHLVLQLTKPLNCTTVIYSCLILTNLVNVKTIDNKLHQRQSTMMTSSSNIQLKLTKKTT